jgi:hypothetical protein
MDIGLHQLLNHSRFLIQWVMEVVVEVQEVRHLLEISQQMEVSGGSNTTGNAPGATYDGSSVRSPASFFGSGDHLVDGMPRLAGVGGASGTQCNVYQVIGQGAVSTNQPSRGGGIVVFENIGP